MKTTDRKYYTKIQYFPYTNKMVVTTYSKGLTISGKTISDELIEPDDQYPNNSGSDSDLDLFLSAGSKDWFFFKFYYLWLLWTGKQMEGGCGGEEVSARWKF